MSELAAQRGSSWLVRALRPLAVWNYPRVWILCSIAFGILGPIVCFAIATPGGILGLGTLPADLFVLIAIVTLATWLLLRGKSAWFDGVACGVFVAGALFAAPFTLMFSLFGIEFLVASVFELNLEGAVLGFLGVQPILALVVYTVNSMRAGSRTDLEARSGLMPVLGFALAVAFPLSASRTRSSCSLATQSSSAGPTERAVHRTGFAASARNSSSRRPLRGCVSADTITRHATLVTRP